MFHSEFPLFDHWGFQITSGRKVLNAVFLHQFFKGPIKTFFSSVRLNVSQYTALIWNWSKSFCNVRCRLVFSADAHKLSLKKHWFTVSRNLNWSLSLDTITTKNTYFTSIIEACITVSKWITSLTSPFFSFNENTSTTKAYNAYRQPELNQSCTPCAGTPSLPIKNKETNNKTKKNKQNIK